MGRGHIIVSEKEIISAAALQQMKSIRITYKKKLISSFGSAEAVMSASDVELKQFIPEHYWSEIPFNYNYGLAEKSVAGFAYQMRAVLGYQPQILQNENRSESIAEIPGTKRLDSWYGAPLLWYEMGLPVDYDRSCVGIMNPGPAGKSGAEKLHSITTENSGEQLVCIITGVSDWQVLKTAVEEFYAPILIVPFGFDQKQIDLLQKKVPDILEKASVISPFLPGSPGTAYRYLYRNLFFTYFIDKLIILWGEMRPHQKIIVHKVSNQAKMIISPENKDNISETDKEADLNSMEKDISQCPGYSDVVQKELAKNPCSLDELLTHIPVSSDDLKQLLVELQIIGAVNYCADGKWHAEG